MNPVKHLNCLCLLATCWLGLSLRGAVQLTNIQAIANQEILLKGLAPAGANYRLDTSANLMSWDHWMTLRGTASGLVQTDTAGPFQSKRFYRGIEVTNILTGDHLLTDDGDVVIHPVDHASFVLNWKDKWIYNDPVGAATLYTAWPKADLILVSHSHGDHFDSTTITAIRGTNALILAPQAVYNSLPTALKQITTVLTNGGSTNAFGMLIEAVGSYNITSGYHPKGVGNGYVITVGNRRLYMAGDTEDVPEMRALKNIDVAFLCMNLPFTMTTNQAASAAKAFKPKVVYPYHFRGSDPGAFKKLLGTTNGVEVRLRKWY